MEKCQTISYRFSNQRYIISLLAVNQLKRGTFFFILGIKHWLELNIVARTGKILMIHES